VCRLLERFPNAAVLVGAYTIGKERIFKVFFYNLILFILKSVLWNWSQNRNFLA
jgi:hypothetical protein